LLGVPELPLVAVNPFISDRKRSAPSLSCYVAL
jgi:hypothetical protein